MQRVPLLGLPRASRDDDLAAVEIARRGDTPVRTPCRVWRLAATVPGAAAARPRLRFVHRSATTTTPAPYRIAPSQLDRDPVELPGWRVEATHQIGPGLPISRRASELDWEVLGTAVHAFLAADDHNAPPERRLAIARRILDRAAMAGVIDAAALVGTSDTLRAYVATRWPTARWDREVPVTALLDGTGGRRRIEGTIDLLLTMGDTVIVIDHKTFPPTHPGAIHRSGIEHAPQLAAYAEALARCGRRVESCHLHFPTAGAWVQLRRA